MPCCTRPSKTKGVTESIRRTATTAASTPGQHDNVYIQPQGSARYPTSTPADQTPDRPASSDSGSASGTRKLKRLTGLRPHRNFGHTANENPAAVHGDEKLGAGSLRKKTDENRVLPASILILS
ncbi:hypothetical protein EPUS_00835 [Endocarpon pusillum Z07020]|uniref:Uncharacterized protein n=1 Tax=Endocarpon pusillum (strain Z07020 / HMAS-L-300199) TaxID=1263415 RepID=U1HVI8_ENDPU|nr:uncharacterized protein EPUS_00835 [Endocarpon pusillum Z07020]ERF74705.1 hypothetical protein EPUS_00835 [Endocarpon pusillum Z07020]